MQRVCLTKHDSECRVRESNAFVKRQMLESMAVGKSGCEKGASSRQLLHEGQVVRLLIKRDEMSSF